MANYCKTINLVVIENQFHKHCLMDSPNQNDKKNANLFTFSRTVNVCSLYRQWSPSDNNALPWRCPSYTHFEVCTPYVRILHPSEIKTVGFVQSATRVGLGESEIFKVDKSPPHSATECCETSIAVLMRFFVVLNDLRWVFFIVHSALPKAS